jgi:outer membrane protein
MKLTTSLLSICFAFLVLFSNNSHAQQPVAQLKIASVDMSKVFAEYYKTKKANSELATTASGYEKELKDRAGELQRLEEEGKKLKEESENPAFTDEKRAEKRKVFDTKRSEFRLLAEQLQNLRTDRQRELKDREGKVRNSLVDEISKVIQDKAKKEGFSLVLDKTGLTFSGVPSVIYVQESMDITGEVIRILNASAPAATTSTEKPKAK